MWRCPTCGQTFVTRNMPHSCLESPRLARVEFIPPYYYVHRIKLRTTADVDDELRGRLAEAYQIGEQRHVHDPTWKKVRSRV